MAGSLAAAAPARHCPTPMITEIGRLVDGIEEPPLLPQFWHDYHQRLAERTMRLLAEHPTPSEQQVRELMDAHLLEMEAAYPESYKELPGAAQ